MSLKPFRLVVLAAWAVTGLTGCGSSPSTGAAHRPAPVGVVIVKPQRVDLEIELTGRTSAFLTADVRPQVSGVVRARSFTEGGRVRKGQPLFQIDPSTYLATLNSARANLAQAKATLGSAKLKAERYRDLAALNAVSRQDNDDAQSTYQQAEANVAVQQAAVDQARINLDYTRVRSPVSGRVGKSSVTPGALVTANQAAALATVQDLSKIYVDVTESAADLLKLRQQLSQGTLGASDSAEVTLTLDNGAVYPLTGRLQFSDVTVDPGTGTVGLRALFPNPRGDLLPGLFVRATLRKATVANGVLAPQAAVSRSPTGEASVLVVGPKGTAELRQIVTGQTVGDQWLVTSGLNPGDQVIVEGLQMLRPGAPVKPTRLASPR